MRARILLLAGATALVLTACSPDVPVSPAVDANDPACAEVIVRLPDTLGDLDRRNTTAQSTAAWGDPSAAILSCGLPPVLASELRCETVDGVDWLVDPANDPLVRFTTFGRTPAVDILIDYRSLSGADVLRSLSPAVSTLPTTDVECTDRPTP